MTAPQYDGRTGRPLYPQTPEQCREDTRRAIASTKQYLRDQVWWRRWQREVVARFWLLMEHGKVRKELRR